VSASLWSTALGVGFDRFPALIEGKTNREIATQLSVAESTVKTRVTSILLKFGVSTRLEAAIVGWETYPMLRVVPNHHHLHIVRDSG